MTHGSVECRLMQPSQKVLEADCLEYMSKMAPASVACVVTSPPYNLGKAYSTYKDNQLTEEYLADQNKAAKLIARLLSPDGHLFLNVGWSTKFPLRSVQVMLEYSHYLVLQQPICWTKSIALDGSSLPKDLREAVHDRTVGHFTSINSDHFLNNTSELIWHFSPSGRSPIDRLAIGVPYVWADQPARFGHNRELHCRGNSWHIPYRTTQSRADRDFHPSPFPIALAERCLKLAGVKPGHLVLDPFAGTGTTLVAAQQLGLTAIGIEIDPGYCETTRRRLRAKRL
jgi:site-specific DNA-methyltransferase (adenine-specific)